MRPPKFGKWVSVGLIVSDHEQEHILGLKLGEGKSRHIQNAMTGWHIISSILYSAAPSHKVICRRATVNHCSWCQSLIQVTEFNSAPVRLFQWPICSEIKRQTIGWGAVGLSAASSGGWCERSIMSVLESARDYKHITHDNLPQGTTCKDVFFFFLFFPTRILHKLPTPPPWPVPFPGWWQSQQWLAKANRVLVWAGMVSYSSKVLTEGDSDKKWVTSEWGKAPSSSSSSSPPCHRAILAPVRAPKLALL